MQNMGLTAESAGIGVQIMSVLSNAEVECALRPLVGIPAHVKTAFASRLGYPADTPGRYLRVRRDISRFTIATPSRPTGNRRNAPRVTRAVDIASRPGPASVTTDTPTGGAGRLGLGGFGRPGSQGVTRPRPGSPRCRGADRLRSMASAPARRCPPGRAHP